MVITISELKKEDGIQWIKKMTIDKKPQVNQFIMWEMVMYWFQLNFIFQNNSDKMVELEVCPFYNVGYCKFKKTSVAKYIQIKTV